MSSTSAMSTPLSPDDISRIIGRTTTALGEIAQVLLEEILPRMSSTQAAQTQAHVSKIVNGLVRALVQETNNGNEHPSLLQQLYTMLQQDVAPVTPSDVQVSDERLLAIVDRVESWRDLVQTGALESPDELEAALLALNLDEQS